MKAVEIEVHEKLSGAVLGKISDASALTPASDLVTAVTAVYDGDVARRLEESLARLAATQCRYASRYETPQRRTGV